MALTANSVLIESQGLLNDPTGSIYPVQALLPLLDKSYRELQGKLAALGISVSKETNSTTEVLVGTLSLVDGGGLPTGLIAPIELGERLLGSADKFAKMEEREWEPDVKQETTLRYWVWREEQIHLIGATTDRQLLIRFIKSLTPITDATSPIVINDSQTWLAQRTAALASLLLGHNPSRADKLMIDLNAYNGPWEDFKAVRIKGLQRIPVRRRRTRFRVP